MIGMVCAGAPDMTPEIRVSATNAGWKRSLSHPSHQP